MAARVKPGKLHFAVISDIHLGHNRNPASRIVANLMIMFPDNAATASLDFIFINGDVFDELLMYNDRDVLDVDDWILYMLGLAKKYDIEICVLEGTPSHDRKQSIHFVAENERSGINAKLRYITDLSLEYFADFDMHILFVPDELAGGPDLTLRNVKDLMRAKGIDKIDFAMMHGVFEFQLPPHVPGHKHSSAEYLSIVRELIFIGHDHTHKQLERIHVNGSADRLGHGYESPKGHMRALQHQDDSWDVSFIENENAMMFVTVDCKGLSLEATFAKLREVTATLPDDANIRVQAEHDHPIFVNMDSAIRLAPTMSWAKDPKREKKDALAPLAETESKYVPITITRENLPQLVLERIATLGAAGHVMDAATDILGELFPWQNRSTTLPAQINEH